MYLHIITLAAFELTNGALERFLLIRVMLFGHILFKVTPGFYFPLPRQVSSFFKVLNFLDLVILFHIFEMSPVSFVFLDVISKGMFRSTCLLTKVANMFESVRKMCTFNMGLHILTSAAFLMTELAAKEVETYLGRPSPRLDEALNSDPRPPPR